MTYAACFRRFLIGLLLVTSMFLVAGHVSAQTTQQVPIKCGPRDKIFTYLKNKFGESPIAAGMAANGVVAMVFGNSKTSSFTWLLLSPTDGLACFIITGNKYFVIPEKLPEARKTPA